jgi:SpoVK/Ycf46/Vps4 family AAA+-type ATPase
MNICLTGNPGCGKTLLGKILAELYCSMGFLKNDNFRIVSKADFVAEYLGQTAIKTKKLLKNSLNSTLFLDEAYSLTNGKEDGSSSDSYGKEAIDTITQFLSENSGRMVFIVAGYAEDMERCFFGINPGLRRRFPWKYHINDYNYSNLKEIFKYQVFQNGWEFEENFNFSDLDTLFSQKEYFKDSGGSCLNLFDKLNKNKINDISTYIELYIDQL